MNDLQLFASRCAWAQGARRAAVAIGCNYANSYAPPKRETHTTSADRTLKAPLRKIAHDCRNALTPRGRRGLQITVELECGHLDTLNATEVRRGKVPCWPCFYSAKRGDKRSSGDKSNSR